MGFDCGFDIYPRLEATTSNKETYHRFLDEIVRTYGNVFDKKGRLANGKLLKTPTDADNVGHSDEIYISFMVGECPRMPANPERCDYFLRFSSKVSGNLTAPAEPYIRSVHKIAKKHFGSRVHFWHEMNEVGNERQWGYYGWQEVHDANRKLKELETGLKSDLQNQVLAVQGEETNDEPNVTRSPHDVDLHLSSQSESRPIGARSPPYLTPMVSPTASRAENDDLSNLMKSISLGDQIGRDEFEKEIERVPQYADLRSEAVFPPFNNLPGENDINLEFYDSADGFSYHPRKHWCFLAEIIDVEKFLRLRLFVKDKANRIVPISFYTDDRGSELPLSYSQKGFTAAILYAEQHMFLDLSVGIRHEVPTAIKVFPLPLGELLILSDKVQQYATEVKGLRTCQGCNQKAASLQKCSRCSLFWYCNKSCQVAGWVEKGHKADCKLLKDPDLQGLFLFKWDEFDNYIRFPLQTTKVEETQAIAALPDKGVVEPAGKPYAIRAIAGKGHGLVATTRITKGTRLLSEIPIFRVPRDNPDIEALERIVADEIKCLNDDQHRSFFDLTNIYGNTHSQSLGIARTNVLPLGSNARSGGLFLEASRINHSCRHNAQNTWNENIGRLTIHALRDIEAGQEITISYLANTSKYAERQSFLKEKFKFECKCELCSLPRAQRKHSNARLEKIQAIDTLIGEFFWGDLEPETALHSLHTMLGLFDEESIWDARVARAYNDAYEIATENEDESRARVFAERAYEARCLIEGDDSPATVKMKRAAEEISAQTPQGMNKAEFEDWLWMLDGASES